LSHFEHFAFFNRTKLSWKEAVSDLPLIDESSSSFLEDAASGRLPAVSWIDPNFKDFNIFGGGSNDDHPPSDIHDGQALVLAAYNALASSPVWEKTLLVITYDEHGGFYDHVSPPPAQDDDQKLFGRYGVRVPAIVVSPWIGKASVSKLLFDHTSIIKTILLRFCPQALERRSRVQALLDRWIPGRPHYMGKRVASANHLGGLLTESLPRPAPLRDALLNWAADRKAAAAHASVLASAPVAPANSELSELQAGIALAARRLREKGLPPIQP
jgi:phospholipase C